MKTLPFFVSALIALTAFPLASSAKGATGKPLVVLISGAPSHGPGLHEYNAGVLLFQKCLQQGAASQVEVKTHLNGEWPSLAELAQAETILVFSDGGEKHLALAGEHLAQLAAQMKRGCGFICLHFALEVPKERGGPEFREWLGGYFEVDWSINPHWAANILELPKHPICRGVKPFALDDEIYYHMRFKEGMAGVTPILSAVPPEKSVWPKDNARGGNPAVRAEVAAKLPQPIAWAVERPDGGRGFGYTVGHTHRAWGGDEQRKILLNAILWTAKVEVPPNGVESTLTAADLSANLDPKGRAAAMPAAPVNPPPVTVAPVLVAQKPSPPVAAPAEPVRAAALTGQRNFTNETATAAQRHFVETVAVARRAYAEELAPALKSAMTSGDLDGANAMNDAKKILDAGGSPPEGKPFTSIRANEARLRFEKSLSAAQKRYADALEGVVKNVLAAGNLDEANAINAELKALGVVAIPVLGSGSAPKPLGAATLGRTAQGLLMTRYPIHPNQADGKRDGAYVAYTDFGKPIGTPRTILTISPWEKAMEENATAVGSLRIDRPGSYEFHSVSDWDRNELWIDGKIVCPYRDGKNGDHLVELRAGLLPLVSVGYAHATRAVKVEWRPPGQTEWSAIPSALFSH